MLNNILNLDGVTVLDKKQQKEVNGGSGECRVFVNDGNGGGHWSIAISYEEAMADINSDDGYTDGSYASGFCCASCGSYKNSPPL